jgi:hypothetical protein
MAACKRGRDGRLRGEKWRGRGVQLARQRGEGRCVNDGDGSRLSNAREGESQREREGEGGGCRVGQLGSGAHLPVEQGERE